MPSAKLGDQWTAEVGGSRGREQLAGAVGGKSWREWLAGRVGGKSWREWLAGSLGGSGWREELAGRIGGSGWWGAGTEALSKPKQVGATAARPSCFRCASLLPPAARWRGARSDISTSCLHVNLYLHVYVCFYVYLYLWAVSCKMVGSSEGDLDFVARLKLNLDTHLTQLVRDSDSTGGHHMRRV